MFKVALRGLAARKLRTVLTAFAVVLGVALISGTYILTDTIGHSFDQVFGQAYKGVDVSVTPKKTFGDNTAPELSDALLTQVQRVPGVEDAAGSVFDDAAIFFRGKRTSKGGPQFVTAVKAKRFDPFQYVEGHAPAAPGEAVIDRHTSQEKHIKIGSTITIVGQGPERPFKVVGIGKYGNLDSIAGSSVAVLTLPDAQRVLGKVGRFDSIDVATSAGVKPEEVVPRIQAVVGPNVTVRTGTEEANQQSRDIKDQLGFFTTFLLVFAGVALLVGGFMIFNTFSITVAQRIREFAILRTLGATRRQVLRSVTLEAFVVGLGASIVGFLLGFALAPGLKGLFSLLGADLPTTNTVLKGRTVIVSLLVGTIITVLSSLSPALRATRVAPVEALREGAVLPRGRGARFRTPVAALLTVLGVALMSLTLFGSAAFALLGLGAIFVFIGVGLLSRHVVKPLASLIGRPLERLRGVTGQLARENSVRNPTRTASTAAALMIGVALVSFVTIFAAGIKHTVNDAVDNSLHGSLVYQNSNQDGESGVPAAAAQDIRQIPGVRAVSTQQFADSKVAGIGGTQFATGIDPQTFGDLYTVDWIEGSPDTIRNLGVTDTVISKKFRDDHDLKVGQKLDVTTPTGREVEYTIRGVYRDDGGLLGRFAVPTRSMRSDWNIRQDQFAMISTTPGANVPAIQKRIDALFKQKYPVAESFTKSEFKDNQAGQVNQVLALFYVLLGLSVIVSLFGIVNTLALSIHERTRELGLLRAIGASRRQIKRLVRYESVITALIGATVGVVLGVFFAAIITQALKDEGLAFALPIGSLIVLVVLAGLAGVLAAISPARRASRLDVLEALAYE
jgi:putative ABC transport system permease protein